MKARMFYAAGLVVAAAFAIGIITVSIERSTPTAGFGEPSYIIDSTSYTEAVTSDTGQRFDLSNDPLPMDTVELDFSAVSCVSIQDGKAIAGSEGGMYIYDPVDSSTQIISVENGLMDHHVTALYPSEAGIYIGTETGLFLRDEFGLITPVIPELQTTVTAIAEIGGEVYIGTEYEGVVKLSGDEFSRMIDVQSVTSLALGGGMMWVGTDGCGLYSYDGIKARKRFLDSDSTAFDIVSSLGYNHNHLYAGTPQGMWVFDGGRWELYDGDDGLIECDITAISFRGWKILAGTRTWGYYEIFEDFVKPLSWSEGMTVTCMASNDSMVVFGTPGDGIFIEIDGKVTNVNPEPESVQIPVYALDP